MQNFLTLTLISAIFSTQAYSSDCMYRWNDRFGYIPYEVHTILKSKGYVETTQTNNKLGINYDQCSKTHINFLPWNLMGGVGISHCNISLSIYDLNRVNVASGGSHLARLKTTFGEQSQAVPGMTRSQADALIQSANEFPVCK